MGISPQEYLMQYRMDKAREMLLESDISIQEIALRVGYDNALTFSKIFKSYYNLSPANYRREKREEREGKTGEE
jgi:transcriptional regulator GlxA family with amidase domain